MTPCSIHPSKCIYLCLFIVRAFAASTNVKEEVEVFIDGKSVMIEKGAALIQACEKAGADVCQHGYESSEIIKTNVFYRFLVSVIMVRFN